MLLMKIYFDLAHLKHKYETCSNLKKEEAAADEYPYVVL